MPSTAQKIARISGIRCSAATRPFPLMNQPRRTMSAALQTSSLPPEALALIKEGTPRSQTPMFTATTTVETQPTPAPASATPKRASEPTPPAKTLARKPVQPETVSLASMNVRVPAQLPPLLLRASADRKIKKIRPFTQQDIIAEAVTDWLRKNGYPE